MFLYKINRFIGKMGFQPSTDLMRELDKLDQKLTKLSNNIGQSFAHIQTEIKEIKRKIDDLKKK